MAAAPCSLDGLVADSGCYDCLSDSEKIAAIVYFYAQILNDLGGTDLTDVNTLREFVACYCVPDGRLLSFEVASAQDAAVSSGSREVLTAAELRTAIKCLTCVPTPELRRMRTILTCLVGDLVITSPV